MSFFDTVLNVLQKDERFFSENGELLCNAVYEAAMKMDSLPSLKSMQKT